MDPGTACTLVQMAIVEFYLDLSTPEETAETKAHIRGCPACKAEVTKVRTDFQALARWQDQRPRREALAAILGRVRGLSSAIRTEDDAADLPGGTGDEAAPGDGDSLAAAAVAEDEEPGLSAPGILMGPAISDEEREKILADMGIVRRGPRAKPAQPPKPAGSSTRIVKLAELAKEAEVAAARASGRMKRIEAEDEWKKMTGTTILRVAPAGAGAGGAAPAAGAAAAAAAPATGAPPPEKPKDSFEALAGTTQIAGAAAAPGAPAGPPPDSVDHLLGVTILGTGGPAGPVGKQYTSRVLRQIKAEDPTQRKLKKGARRAAGTVPAWAFSAGAHAAVLLVLGFIAIHVLEKPPEVQITVKPQQPPEEEKKELPKPEDQNFRLDEETDPTKETKTQDEPEEAKDLRSTEKLGVVTDSEKAAGVSEAWRDLGDRIGKGKGDRGQGPNARIELGLQWLRAHQSLGGEWDGAWRWKHHVERCQEHAAPACDCCVDEASLKEDRNFDVGLTGLGLLCFTGSGYGHVEPAAGAAEAYKKRHALSKDTVARAIRFLLSRQDPDGAIGRKVRGKEDPDNEDPEGYMYNHAIATLALCDAYAFTRDAELAGPARKALEWCAKAQDPKTGGWDYYAHGNLTSYERNRKGGAKHRGDLSITGWMVMAMKVAEIAGLEFPKEMRDKAKRFVDAMARDLDEGRGHARYAEGYFLGYNLNQLDAAIKKAADAGQKKLAERIRGVKEQLEPRRGVCMTAVATLARMYLGSSVASEPVQNGIKKMLQEPPSVAALKGETPSDPLGLSHFHTYYYWYYGTLALWNSEDKYWYKWWDDSLKEAITSLQVTEDQGPAAGSWPPVDPVYGPYGGRLYSTTMAILTCEAFYRFSPLSKKESFVREERKFEEIVAHLDQALAR
ncbi:MAG: hypothetical protein L0216_13795, partial [Planctomycetales bacterium]|nr:hypothetical protein [Planctomycetales bacterium]